MPMEKTHPVQLEKEIHDKLKEYSKKTGIKIKYIVEAAITAYLNTIKFQEIVDERNEKWMKS